MTANRDRGSVAGPSTAAKSPTGIAEDDLKALTEH
jgi:hypothetical protein